MQKKSTVKRQTMAAPQGAVYWSPAVEQYFDHQYMNLAFKEQGKYVQVEASFRHELVPLIEMK